MPTHVQALIAGAVAAASKDLISRVEMLEASIPVQQASGNPVVYATLYKADEKATGPSVDVVTISPEEAAAVAAATAANRVAREEAALLRLTETESQVWNSCD